MSEADYECEDMMREVEAIEKMEVEIKEKEKRMEKKRKLKEILASMNEEEKELDEMVS